MKTFIVTKSVLRWNKIMKQYNEFVVNGLLEDRREYGLEDYKNAYPEFSFHECTELMGLVEKNFR